METELIGISQNIAQIPENVETELDRRLFHLKTLYDVSREGTMGSLKALSLRMMSGLQQMTGSSQSG
jgi:hypothetical protein